MLDPVVVEGASMRPGTCLLCRSHVGPFVDTRVDIAVVGRVYVCVATCGGQIAGLAGFVDAAVLAERDGQLDDAVAEIAELEAAVAAANADRVVPLAEVERLFGRGVSTAARCVAARKDGSPCSAAALPGRDTCVAHSSKAAAATAA